MCVCNLFPTKLRSGHPTGCGMSGTMSTLTDVFPQLIQKHTYGWHLALTRSLTNSKHKVIVGLVVDRIQYVKHLNGEISHCAQVHRNGLLYLYRENREKTERLHSYTTTFCCEMTIINRVIFRVTCFWYMEKASWDILNIFCVQFRNPTGLEWHEGK